jgi:predicted metal-dependent phosphoesterase TrpH
MLYKYETHMHTSRGSACGRSAPADMVRAYRAAGYAGAVMTDHFVVGNTAVPRDLPWRERMELYYAAYLEAKPVADALDFDLHFGIEQGYGNAKEVLIYGVTPEFLIENSDIPNISIHEFAGRIHAAGGFITHAHPFRARSYCPPNIEPTVDFCDAIEVYNYSDPPDINAKADALARALGMTISSGADAHWADFSGVGQAGLAFSHKVRTSEELVAALRGGEGRLIIGGEISDITGGKYL